MDWYEPFENTCAVPIELPLPYCNYKAWVEHGWPPFTKSNKARALWKVLMPALWESTKEG